MCVAGDGCVRVPISLCVCVCVCMCVLVSSHAIQKRCINVVYFVCGAQYGGGIGDHGAVHKWVVTLNG